MRILCFLLLIVGMLAGTGMAQTYPPSNEYFIFDGSAESLFRFTAGEDGLYMAYRPELCRGLKTVEDWSFVVEDLDSTTKETVALEIRKDNGEGLPSDLKADLIWSVSFANIDFSTNPTPGVGAYTVTPFTKVVLPSTEIAYWMGFHWPAMPATQNDGMVIQASATTQNNACQELPRDEKVLRGLCAGIDFTPTTGGPGHVVAGNIALFSMVTFTEPVLQGFANNYGFVTSGAINFCSYDVNTKSFIPAPKSAPVDNFGYAGIWPDIDDFGKQGRRDKFGWQVRANQFANNGGTVVLLLSDKTFDPGFLTTAWDTLYLSPLSTWFSIAMMMAPLKSDLTTNPPMAWASFGPFDLGPAAGVWAASVGPLHGQAVVIDGKNPNNILFSNMTTMNFAWTGKTTGKLDQATTSQYVAMPTTGGYRQATVHSLRGYLTIQAEINSTVIGPKLIISPGCTQTLPAIPNGGGVRISLDTKSQGAEFDVNFQK